MVTTPSGGSDNVHFAQFDVTDQVFLRTEHVVGIVNLKPIVPFHVLLIPPSPSITRLSLLPTASLAPFFRAVQLVTSRLEEVTGASSSNVAIQDGKEAGQSVAHLHVHVLPRKRGDEYAGSDEIYDRLESFGFNLSALQTKHAAAAAALDSHSTSQTRSIKPDADEDRRPRSREEMKAEADWLRKVFKDVDFRL
ncbi:HIT-like protein [Microstroma glucosiphilum]|uniref:HIT-like protein n=1 Tax=Pseudomicrostroma glucosiphilum TaxID=1684307 RepID=A0A316UHP9_9BASI|nr:HIT-like protein [Pseudomicrostroma glucosiphilum]PWN22715.1 HIT-like protein [Pseudomicrostroma glucosiphilum]